MLSLGCSHDVGLTFVNQLQWQAQVCTGKPPIIYGHRERSPAAGKKLQFPSSGVLFRDEKPIWNIVLAHTASS